MKKTWTTLLTHPHFADIDVQVKIMRIEDILCWGLAGSCRWLFPDFFGQRSCVLVLHLSSDVFPLLQLPLLLLLKLQLFLLLHVEKPLSCHLYLLVLLIWVGFCSGNLWNGLPSCEGIVHMPFKLHPPDKLKSSKQKILLPGLSDDALLCPADVVLPVPVVDKADGGDGASPPLVQLLRSLLKLCQLRLQLLFQLCVPLVLRLRANLLGI